MVVKEVGLWLYFVGNLYLQKGSCMKSRTMRYRGQKCCMVMLIMSQFLYVSSMERVAEYDPSGLLAYFKDFEIDPPAFLDGAQSYKDLNSDTIKPFVVGVGTSMSQTHQVENTVSDSFIRSALQSVVKKLPVKKAEAWLKSPDRIWYILRSLPEYSCENGHVTDPVKLDLVADSGKITAMLTDMAHHRVGSALTITHCPDCQAPVTERVKVVPVFTKSHQEAMLEQVRHLHIFDQFGYKMGLPGVRISLEAADVMVSGSTELSTRKLAEQALFINSFGNPLLFFHHYANPQTIPDLFEKPEHAMWFARYCVEVLKLSPQVTHVCPMSQPLGFAFRVVRGTLPPFKRDIDQEKYVQNIVNAQVVASQEIKKLNKDIQVLVSHQWKSMKPKHTSLADPRRAFEIGICKIADKMYNGKFIALIKPHMKHFNGIALSIYPALHFNLWAPEGDNIAGKIDFEAALEALVETSKAFEGKDIYVVETGCNTADNDTKRQFIDMTLYACRIARDKGIPVKGVYFWGITNDKDFYSEWNSAPGSTYFGPFDRLDVANPLGSINAAGQHLKYILSPSLL